LDLGGAALVLDLGGAGLGLESRLLLLPLAVSEPCRPFFPFSCFANGCEWLSGWAVLSVSPLADFDVGA
jgi:hypothetical protein